MGKFRGHIPPHLTTGSEEQGYVEKVFKAVGAIRYRLVNYGGRGGGTKGYVDDLFFFPGPLILLAWDSKVGDRPYHRYDKVTGAQRFGDGYLTEEQEVFGGLMAQGYRTAFGYGDRDKARAWLADLANRPPGPHIVKGS